MKYSQSKKEVKKQLKAYRDENLWWETKEGKSIRIQDMEKAHLSNCLRMMNRNHPNSMIVNILKAELLKRPIR